MHFFVSTYPQDIFPNKLSFVFLYAFKFHISVRALLDPELIWFGYITRLSQWGGGGGGNLPIQIIYTCRHGLSGMGEGVGTLWLKLSEKHENEN